MTLAQVIRQNRLRDSVTCLHSHYNKLYHLGLSGRIRRNTLVKADENRD